MSVGVHGSLVTCMYMFSAFLNIDKDTYSRLSIVWGMKEMPVAGIAGITLIIVATVITLIILPRFEER